VDSDRSRPNIVYILADDLGYGDVSAFNENAAWKTPNIDLLAEEGIQFTDAHSGSAVCTPTRYGILTGRYSWRTSLKEGVLWSWDEPLIQPDRMTVEDMLKSDGYTTACIGKWHLGLGWQYLEDDPDSVDFSQPLDGGPMTAGFDYFYGIAASLDIPPYVYIENDQSTTVPVKYTVSTDKYGWWRNGLTGSDFEHVQVLPQLTTKAVDFIHQHAETKPNQPFFLYFPLPAPHTPILPTDQFKGRTSTNPYGDFVVQVDWTVGQVMQALEANGYKENTLFVFTSDNGCAPHVGYEELAQFGHDPSYVFRGTKADIFEGGHRIPFVCRWPGVIPAGTSSDQTICLTDLMATCADIIEAELDAQTAVDSYSLLPILKGETLSGSLREATVHHSVNGSFAIRKGKWKLVLCPGSGGWSFPKPNSQEVKGLPPVQLYDLENDVGELENLQDQYPEVVQELKDLLKQYIEKGRSTPGPPQEYVKVADWPGLAWMGE